MKIEYDDYYKCWVVWEKSSNVSFERYRGTQKDCKAFIKKNNKRKKDKNVQQKNNRK